jgi:hypothetical protein
MITTWLQAAAFAQEPDIEIDLGGSEATPVTYNTSYTSRAPDKIAANAPIKVTSSVGTTTVYCTDTEAVEARYDVVLSGLDAAALESWGKSFRVSTTAGASGSVTFLAGTRPSSVKNANVTLVVNVPKQAKLTISANGDWVKVVGCDGTVSATAKTSAFVSGPLDGFNVTASNGAATVEVEGDSKILSASAISAPKGDVTLTLPLSQDLKLDARGSAVTVAHTVTGTVDTVAVTGTIGAGGPALTLKASGAVTVKIP